MMGEGLDAGVIERSEPPQQDAGHHAQEADVTSSQGLEPHSDGPHPVEHGAASPDAAGQPVEVAEPADATEATPQPDEGAAAAAGATPQPDEGAADAAPEATAEDSQADGHADGQADAGGSAQAGEGSGQADDGPAQDSELAAGGHGDGADHGGGDTQGGGAHDDGGHDDGGHGGGDAKDDHGGGERGGGDHGGHDGGGGDHGGDGVAEAGDASEAVSGVGDLLDGGILDLSGEIEGLSSLLRGVGLLEAVAILVFGMLGILGVRMVARWLRSSGLDPSNNVSRISTVAIVVVVVVVLDLFFLWLLKYAPLIALVVFLLTVLVLGLSAVSLIQNLFAGVDIAMRGQLVPGVHVSIGDDEGIVERVGPTALSLRTKDGATLQIPNSRFRADPFVTRGAERTARVDLRFKLRAPATQKNIEDARRAVILCPYRYHASEIQVAIEGEDGDLLALAFEAPSESFAEHAEHFMRRALETLLV